MRRDENPAALKPGVRAGEMPHGMARAPHGEGSAPDTVRARLHVLFRHSIREGLINPLLHLVAPCRSSEPS